MLLLLIALYGCMSYADLEYTSVSKHCGSFSGPGKAVYCCSGACLDGTSIGQHGQCKYFMDLCGDLQSGTPSCRVNQVLQYNDVPPTNATGDGCCGACCCECQWVRNEWNWSCCDCPKGYQAVSRGLCDGASSQCVGCTGSNEVLTGNATAGYSCESRVCSLSPSATPGASGDSITRRDSSRFGCTFTAAQQQFIKKHEGLPGTDGEPCLQLGDPGCARDTLGEALDHPPRADLELMIYLGWGHDCNAHSDCPSGPIDIAQAQTWFDDDIG